MPPHARCSQCNAVLLWANGLLVCIRIGCPGHQHQQLNLTEKP
jgi:hypothetical protein